MKNNITYAGTVRIKIKGKPPTRKNNNGTNAFFNILRDLLITAADARTARLPTFMSIVQLNSEPTDKKTFFNENSNYRDDKNYTKLSFPLSITSRVAKVNPNNDGYNPFVPGTCVLSALFHHSSAITNSTSNDSIIDENIYVILLDSDGTILAYTSIKYKDLQPVFDDENGQAVIEWELSFGNKEGN